MTEDTATMTVDGKRFRHRTPQHRRRLGALVCVMLAASVLAAPASHAQSSPAVPAMPVRPKLAASSGQFAVSWTAPNDNGSAITDYDVRYAPYAAGGSPSWTEWEPSTTSTATTATVTGLQNGHWYSFQVRAENANGAGPWSQSSLANLDVPQHVTSVTATRVGTTLQVTWPQAYEPTVTGYHVVYSPDDKRSWTRSHTNLPYDTSALVGSVSITGTDPSLPYHVAVAVVNGFGHSIWTVSNRVAPVPVSLVPPAAPSSVSLDRSSSTLTASWAAVTGATGYNVVYSTTKRRSWVRLSTNQAATTATITGTDDGQPYIFGVQAVNAAGVSGWVNSNSVRALLLPPASVTATRTAGQVEVSWPAVTGAVDYDVVYSTDGRYSWTRHATALAATSTTITGADDTATYHVAVRAVNVGAASSWRNSAAIPPL